MKLILATAILFSSVLSLAQKLPTLDTNPKKPYKERMEKYIRELFKYDTIDLQKYFQSISRNLVVQQVFQVDDRVTGLQPMSFDQYRSQRPDEEQAQLVAVEFAGTGQPVYAIYSLNETDRGIHPQMQASMIPIRQLVAFAYNGSRSAYAEKKFDRGNGEARREFAELFEFLSVESDDPAIAREEVIILPSFMFSRSQIDTVIDASIMRQNQAIEARVTEKTWYEKAKVSDENVEAMLTTHNFFIGDKDLDGDGKSDVVQYLADGLPLDQRKNYGATQFKHKSNKLIVAFSKENRNFLNGECVKIPTNNGEFCGKGLTSWRPAYIDANQSQIVLVYTPKECGFEFAKTLLVLDAPDESKAVLIYGVVKYGNMDRVGIEEKPLTPEQKACLLKQPNNEILSMMMDHSSRTY